VIEGPPKLVIELLAYRKLNESEVDRLLGVFFSTKEGRKALRSGGKVRSFTSIGGRDSIGE
jgi:hypothetical protein